METRLLIIGSGVAGLSAAIAAGRARLAPLVVEGLPPGGQLGIGTDVDNYPGFARPIAAADLVAAMRAQAERAGARFVAGAVTAVDLGRRPFTARTDEIEIRAASVIVAAGAGPRRLAVPGADELWGYGVSSCATCDGFFCKDQDVVVVGGGDTAIDEALYLATLCPRVTVVHRRDRLRAAPALAERARLETRIELVWNAEIARVHGVRGGGGVTGVDVRDVRTGEERHVPAAGLFVAIGYEPATRLFAGQLELNRDGTLRVDGTRASVRGVFGAGDAIDAVYRQAVTAAGQGTMAAMDAERFLAEQGS
jgi:thioredoxin reductase (NADPH)